LQALSPEELAVELRDACEGTEEMRYGFSEDVIAAADIQREDLLAYGYTDEILQEVGWQEGMPSEAAMEAAARAAAARQPPPSPTEETFRFPPEGRDGDFIQHKELSPYRDLFEWAANTPTKRRITWEEFHGRKLRDGVDLSKQFEVYDEVRGSTKGPYKRRPVDKKLAANPKPPKGMVARDRIG
jgi:hypothetical protein